MDTLGLQFVLRNDNQSMKQLSSLSIIIADDDNFSCSTLQKLLKTLPLIRSYGINIIKTENGLAVNKLILYYYIVSGRVQKRRSSYISYGRWEYARNGRF